MTSLLSFLDTSQGKYFDCIHLRVGLNRIRGKVHLIGIWSGGLKVSSNAGEQYVSGHDDFVESSFKIPTDETGTLWYQKFAHEMKELDNLSKVLYSATLNYYKNQNMNGEDLAKKACHTYWQLCERNFQELVSACQNENKMKSLRKKFSGIVNNAYRIACPRNTARQMDSWASNRPNLNKYLC